MKELKFGDLVKISDNCDYDYYQQFVGKIGIYIRESDEEFAYPFCCEVCIGGNFHSALKRNELIKIDL